MLFRSIVPKAGYKVPLLFCAVACSAAFFSAVYLNTPGVIYVATLLALTGVQLHYIILAPFVAAYTSRIKNKDIDWYTRAYYMGYVGYFLTTYLGGLFTVKMFSLHAGLSYTAAKGMTAYIADVSPALKAAYIQGNKDVLLMTGVLSALCIPAMLLIREEKADYASARQEKRKSLRERVHDLAAVLLCKDALLYLLYWAIVSFAMGLFTSYYTVFLNRNLHIDKATSSLLVSISYMAIVVFMLFTPMVVKKMGPVGTICASMLLSIPFMLLIANGDAFGRAMVPVVGVALFMRAGLANLSSPADSALCMYIAPKQIGRAHV